jgi:phosphoribosyl 1,2-cyclic phosphate phosphodiesterase
MQVLLMGTGGADGVPALFGRDRVSQYARQQGGKDMRSRSAALIDGSLKIDLGPDTLSQVHRHRLDAVDWEALIFTHSDRDHLCLSELQYGLFPFVNNQEFKMRIYANETVCRLISNFYPHWPMDLHTIASGDTFEELSYTVTCIKALHTPGEDCLNLIIERDNRKFLYATDTGYYTDEVFDQLAGCGLNALVMECSDGRHKTPYIGHMDIHQMVDAVERLRESGGLAADAQVFSTHHTANGDMTHQELERALLPYNITPGFDGLTFEV